MKKEFIPSLPKYIITSLGQVFRANRARTIFLPNQLQGSNLIVCIDGNNYNVFNLLCEAFKITYTPLDKIRYRINRKSLTISVDSIKIKKVYDRAFYDTDQEFELKAYFCNEKASNANTRFPDKITGIEVYNALKRQKHECFYCGKKIDPKAWQLDHFYSKFHGGKNVSANLVASCPTCNVMKHTLNGEHFVKRCCKIANRLKKSLKQD